MGLKRAMLEKALTKGNRMRPKPAVGLSNSMKPPRVCLISVLCVCIGLFLHGSNAFAQSFEVKHFAGSPGGIGTADGFGPAARFQSPSAIWGDGTYLYVGDHIGRGIRRITIATGEVRLIAGSLSSAGIDNVPGSPSGFMSVQGFWGDGAYLYIADCSSLNFHGTPFT